MIIIYKRNMKYIYHNISLIILSVLFCWGCSDNDDEQATGSQPVFGFLQSTIEVPYSAGEAIVVVENAGMAWEIVMDENKGIVSGFSQTQNGSSEESKKRYTQVKISYGENPTEEVREQEIFLINKETEERKRMTVRQNSKFAPVSLIIDASTKYQYVDGIGGMNTETKWVGDEFLITEKEMAKMYGPGSLGFNILHIMTAETQKVLDDNKTRALWAQRLGATIFASSDVSASLRSGSGDNLHIDPSNYEAYADYIIDYINDLKESGVNLYAISLQNEPDMSGCWTPDAFRDFVKTYGAKIKATGVKIMTPEACGFQPEYTDPILNDPAAFGVTDIVAGHLYQGFMDTTSDYVRERHDYICNLYNNHLAPAGKGGWWMTEHLFNDGEKEDDQALWLWWNWDYSLSHLGKEVHMCMDGFCSAYIYFYLKRFYSILGDPDGRSPVASGEIMQNGYILSHYAKYASNMTRVKVDCGDDEVLATAYVNASDDEITLVLLNMKNGYFKANISVPNVISEINAIETNADRTMEDATTYLADDQQSASVLLSPVSIVSVRLKLK